MNPKSSPKNESARLAQELMQTEQQSATHNETQKTRFAVSTVSVSDIPQAQRLGRKSQWGYLITQVQNLSSGQALNFIVQEQNEISSLRASIKKAGLSLTTRTETVNNNPKDKRIRVYIWKA